ncbi:MAG TPA: hypothetical protein VFG68_02925 [Fimbriiglobus sp.]|nr:hypothetical protein [Fimbriiglobus sp.]
MRRIAGTAALFGMLVAGAGLAQDGPVAIKLKKAGPGDVVKETRTETTSQKVTVTVMGQTKTNDVKATGNYDYIDDVIEKPKGARKPTKLKRTYESADLTANGQKQDLGLKGQTVLIEKKGDKYTFTVGGKPLTGKAAELLGKEFSDKKQTGEEDYLPGKPVRVGESWPIDVAKVAGELAEGGMVIDVTKSSATGKLTKVYDKRGKKFGVIEVAMGLVVTKLASGPQEVPLKDSKLTVTLTMDGCIDGTEATGGGKMSMTGKLTGEFMVPGVGAAQMVVDVDLGMTGNTVQVKK